jgi:hypothetical protein
MCIQQPIILSKLVQASGETQQESLKSGIKIIILICMSPASNCVCWCSYPYLQVSDEEKDSVRSAYLRRHPDAFWVYFLNVVTVAKTKGTLMEYWLWWFICQIKVDFGDFSFLHIKPKAVRYVSGVATALLGSGGRCLFESSRGKLLVKRETVMMQKFMVLQFPHTSINA